MVVTVTSCNGVALGEPTAEHTVSPSPVPTAEPTVSPSPVPTADPTVARRRLIGSGASDGYLRGIHRRLLVSAELEWTAAVIDIQQYGYTNTDFDANGEPEAAGEMFRDIVAAISENLGSVTFVTNLQNITSVFNNVTAEKTGGGYEFTTTITATSQPTPQPTAFTPTLYPTSQPSTTFESYSVDTSPTTNKYIAWLPISSASDHLGILMCIVGAIAGILLTLYLVTAHNTKIANLVMLEERRYDNANPLSCCESGVTLLQDRIAKSFLETYTLLWNGIWNSKYRLRSNARSHHHHKLPLFLDAHLRHQVCGNVAMRRREMSCSACRVRARPRARPHRTLRSALASTAHTTWAAASAWMAVKAVRTNWEAAARTLSGGVQGRCIRLSACGRTRTRSYWRWCISAEKRTCSVAARS